MATKAEERVETAQEVVGAPFMAEERPRTAREVIDGEPTVSVRIPLAPGVDPDTVEQVIPVQVNGVYMQLSRGDAVDIPVSMYLVLRQTGRYDIQ